MGLGEAMDDTGRSGTTCIRVLLNVHGNTLLAGIHTLLDAESNIDMVRSVESRELLPPGSSSPRSDVVVLDSGSSGSITAVRPVRADEPSRRVVLLIPDTPTDSLLLSAMDRGVRGLVVRDGPIEEILHAIEAVHAGRAWIDSAIAGRVLQLIGGRRRDVFLPDLEYARFTQREREVLECLAEGGSNSEIADRLSISQRTVKYHVSHILEKLRARDRAHAVALAYRAGFWSDAGRTYDKV
jgi:two-component system, NarL family, response regulator DesR